MAQKTLTNNMLKQTFRENINDNFTEVYADVATNTSTSGTNTTDIAALQLATGLRPQDPADIVASGFTAEGAVQLSAPTTETIRVHATADCWLTFEGITKMPFAAGTEIIKRPAAATYVVVRGMVGAGSINMTGLSEALPEALGDTVDVRANNSVALPTPLTNIRMHSAYDCYYLLGDNTVSATSTTGTFFAAGTEYLEVPLFHKPIVITASLSGALVIGSGFTGLSSGDKIRVTGSASGNDGEYTVNVYTNDALFTIVEMGLTTETDTPNVTIERSISYIAIAHHKVPASAFITGVS